MIQDAELEPTSVLPGYGDAEAERIVEALAATGAWLRSQGYRFTAVTPATHARVLDRGGRARDVRDIFGWNRPFARDLLPSPVFDLLEAAELLGRQDRGWRSRVRYATLGDALYAHGSHPTTESDAVFFGPDSYRYAAALRRTVPACSLLVDIGCGSGVGGLEMRDRAARVVLTDINPRALLFARANARLAGVDPDAVEFRCGDLLDQVADTPEVIIANPPYLVDAGGRIYRDGGGDRGVALAQRIVAESVQRLRPGGQLILYTGTPVVDGVDAFRHRISLLLEQADADVAYEELDPDVFGEELATEAYADAERIAVVLLHLTRRPARIGTHVPDESYAESKQAALHQRLGAHVLRRLAPAVPDAEPRANPKAEAADSDVLRNFLAAERQVVAERAAAAPHEPEAFLQWFTALEATGPGQHDTLFAWLATSADLEQFRWFLAQELAGEAGFDDLVALTQVKMPPQAKLEMARNLWDEFGRGNPLGVHAALLERTAADLGIAADAQTTLWQPQALANLMAGMAMDRRYAYHSVGALGAIELTAPGRVAQVSAGLRRLGIGASTRRYFDLHAGLDVAHAKAWCQEVLAPLLAADPQLATPLAEGALMRLEAGRRCFAAYRAHFGLAG